jgi:rhamnogalacturonyl hydrolase YesR
MQQSRYALVVLVLSLGCRAPERPLQVPSHGSAPEPADAPPQPALARAAQAALPAAPVPPAAKAEGLTIEVQNPLSVARTAETISLALSEVVKLLPSLQVTKTVVQGADGGAVLSQLVDSDGDERADALVFQTDLGPNEHKRFVLGEGVRGMPRRDQFKVYGRFVRERHDDFAWENDRIAHRVYGPDLETWAQEPLTSSGVDIWAKRTSRLVINDWYQSDDYHRDNGDGGDFYSVGASRGCGGLGIWDGKALHVARNFRTSRVLANGPIRLIFELSYAPWDAGGGVQIAETKRVTVDASSHFDRFESSFKISGQPRGLALAVGIAKHNGSTFEADPQNGVLRSWEPFPGDNGHVGCAVISAAGAAQGVAESATDRLLLSALPNGAPAAYLAGFGWDRGGDVADNAAWSVLVASTARELHHPVSISLSKPDGPARSAALVRSARVVSGLIAEHPTALTDKWAYDSGLVLKGMLEVWKKTHDAKYFAYVKATIDSLLDGNGNIVDFRPEEHNLDAINMGKILFPLLAHTTDERDRARYKRLLTSLREQLKKQPRTRDGGFWHKQIYAHQMWLDGVYMAAPFLAEYGLTFGEPAAVDEAANQVLLAEKHLRDPKTGLLYHGWDETHAERWSNPKTGTSSQFWGRSLGWYAMAVVDILELLPEGSPRRGELRAVLSRLAKAVVAVQDKPSGVWWQVLDAPGREKNYRESSASAMFVYALAKAVRLGLVERGQFEPTIARGARGLIEQFASIDEHERLHLKNICKVAGLGGDPYRDGSYAYYTGTEISDNDPKGVGAFILASVETE